MNFAFRVDASSEIGTGHFMRCLTLAINLKKHGCRVRFVSRHLPEHLRGQLAEDGFESVLLNTSQSPQPVDELVHAHWLGVNQRIDARDSIQALSDQAWDWIIVDHYALDARWESALRRNSTHIFVIDDIADRSHDCDMLLDQNFFTDMADRYKDRVPLHCRLLLGPRYVLLREEFQLARQTAKVRSGPVGRLLVIFGGVDASNYTGRIIKVLETLKTSQLLVDVVVGAQHMFRNQIRSDCLRLGFFFHLQTNEIAQMMARADLAIGACGFTTYEFAATKLPAIVIPATEIQALVAKALSDKGIAFALFPKNTDVIENITEVLRTIMDSTANRLAMSRACNDFLDTDGAKRVVSEILRLQGR